MESEAVVKCPYCKSPAELIGSAKVYHGRDYGKIYCCTRWPACDAYVGVHRGTRRPLGTMANAELRRARSRAHAAFDPVWRGRRADGYKWLAATLGLCLDACHISMMGPALCERVVEVCTIYQGGGAPVRKVDKEEMLFTLNDLAEHAFEMAGSLNREVPTVATQVIKLAEMVRELAQIVSEVVDAQPEA